MSEIAYATPVNDLQRAWFALKDAAAAEYEPMKATPAGQLAMEMWRDKCGHWVDSDPDVPVMVGQACSMGTNGTAIIGPFAPVWATYLREASRVLDLLERAKTRAAS